LLRASLAARSEPAAAVAGHLVARYGTEATAVLELGEQLDLLRPLVEGHPYLEAEVAWAAREELALSVDDILARRTRLAIETGDQAAGAARRVAELLGREHGWSDDGVNNAAARYSAQAPGEYGLPGPGSRTAEGRPFQLSEVVG
jgi:glycerol-3-phosphate dehydrogenase